MNFRIANSVGLTVLGAFALLGCNQGSSSSPARPAAPQNQNFVVTPSGEVIPKSAAGAAEFNGTQFDPYTALDTQLGNWQTIGQERYFAPKGLAQDWQPYQNGSWNFDEDKGWTFISPDKWSWVTEHYGLWRHHNRYGWIWLPFQDRHYEPSVVTWFNQDQYVGWYPYSETFKTSYVNGFGFDDGFWAGGYRSVIELGFSRANFSLGIVLVDRANVTRPHLANYLIHDRAEIQSVVRLAHSEDAHHGFVGPIPGGGDIAHSHEFIQQYSSFKAPVGHTQAVIGKGGARIIQPFMPTPSHADQNHLHVPDNHNVPSERPAQQPRAQAAPVQPTQAPTRPAQTPVVQPAQTPAPTHVQPRVTPSTQAPKTETHTDDRGNRVTTTQPANSSSSVTFNGVKSSGSTSAPALPDSKPEAAKPVQQPRAQTPVATPFKPQTQTTATAPPRTTPSTDSTMKTVTHADNRGNVVINSHSANDTSFKSSTTINGVKYNDDSESQGPGNEASRRNQK